MKRRCKFKQLKDGQWSARAKRRKNGAYLQKIKCCDCGLVHLMQYELTARGLRFRAWREPAR